MRGEIGTAREKGKGKRARAEEAGRRRRSFSYTALLGDLQGPALSQKRQCLLAKAKELAFPVDAVGKYKLPSLRIRYGRDVSAGGSIGLSALHKLTLDLLLHDLLLHHQWPQVAGILSVLLRALLAEREWNPRYAQYFRAAMEATRQLEGLQGNDIKFRKMYQILHDKQPKGIWSRNKAEAGAVRLELALYLMSQKQYDDANLACGPYMDIAPYRDHSVANLIYGLIHYYQWFESVKKEVQQESERRVAGHSKKEDVDFMEGVGENDGVNNDNYTYTVNLNNEECTFRQDDDLISDDTDTSTLSKRNGYGSSKIMSREPMPLDVKEETPWNLDDDVEEENEKSYMKKARVVYRTGLDQRLFPFNLPRSYLGKNYAISMGAVTVKNSHSTAIKHLRDALSLDRHSTAALLPLVQLMLAGADVEGAYVEIEKCCENHDDCIPFSIKCMLLESSTPKNKDMLIHVYQKVLERDPSSTHPIERLIDMHKAGEYRTDALLEQLGVHLDGCLGSVLVWRKLVSCFRQLKEVESQHSKETGGIYDNLAPQDSFELDFFQKENIQAAWKLRERWWPVKHFRSSIIEEELNTKGIQWLVYKAASAAHIFGFPTLYVVEVEKHLQSLGQYRNLAKLQRHKVNSLNLLSHCATFKTRERLD